KYRLNYLSMDYGRWGKGRDRWDRALVALDLHQSGLGDAALRQLGRALVQGEHIGVPVLVETPDLRGIQRVEPGPRRQLHDARTDGVGHHRTGQAGAPGIVQPYHIPAGDAPRRGVLRVDPDRFALRHFRAAADLTAVQLAVQPRLGLIGEQVQGIDLGLLGPEPFGRGQPHRVARAVVIAKRRNRVREDLDPSRGGPERMRVRVSPVGGEQHRRIVWDRELDRAGFPEGLEAR